MTPEQHIERAEALLADGGPYGLQAATVHALLAVALKPAVTVAHQQPGRGRQGDDEPTMDD